MIDTSEKNFESDIEAYLLANDYHSRTSNDYDKKRCLIPQDVFNFIHATQPQEWQKYQEQYGDDAPNKLLQRLAQQIKKRGTLELLRKGLKANGCKFKLAYFRPSTELNNETQRLYQANFFSLIRQFYYSEKTPDKSIDLAIFLNGLPIFTSELKNPFKGQTVQDAVRQYRNTRDHRETVLSFGVCLSHFAVDPDLVYMTTHLQGENTSFLPFNQGRDNGAGNPPSALSYSTAYLWEQTWHKDSILNLIQNFITQYEEEDEKGKKTGKKKLIFPRYHQLDTVNRLLTHAKDHKTGQKYLIQHSAGSGKSNTITWLAYQLVNLHDTENNRVFDSILIITDRKVLDKQLQRNLKQFETVAGVVENIDKTSRQLKEALENGKNIIVTTLQKFPRIIDQITSLQGQNFAIIIDEAHSSQTGENSRQLKAVLSTNNLEEAENQDTDLEEDIADRIEEAARTRGNLPNLSYFAFTATPKPKTLELFGIRQPDGTFNPFSPYSMRQAIEERFILDVLQNYTTYQTYFSLLRTIEDDPHYDRNKAGRILRNFVDLHPHNISQKVAIIVEHFHNNVAHQINGQAKAMIVTRSRLHAVRYKLALDHYLEENAYPYQSLVAFTGTVNDGGIDFTETGMNTASAGVSISEKATAETFKQNPYKFLIVANKFQTGFNQPLLTAMYVDKKLGGINAVQTLSRLNRIHPQKESTVILDFANDIDVIQSAFEDYYDRTVLSQETDVNLVYDIQQQLDDYEFYEESDITDFAQIYFNPQGRQDRLHNILVPVIDRYQQSSEEEQFDFRTKLKDFIRLYSFIGQLMPIADPELEQYYQFARHLAPKLPFTHQQLPLEVQQNIELSQYRIQATYTGQINLQRGERQLEPIMTAGTGNLPLEDREALSVIIEQINQQFGTNFTEDEQVFIEQLENRLDNSESLQASLQVNSPENVRLTFNNLTNEFMQEMIESNFNFYRHFNDDGDFANMLLNWLFQRFLERQQSNGEDN